MEIQIGEDELDLLIKTLEVYNNLKASSFSNVNYYGTFDMDKDKKDKKDYEKYMRVFVTVKEKLNNLKELENE